MPRPLVPLLTTVLVALALAPLTGPAAAQTPPAPTATGSIGVAPGTIDPADPRTRAYFVRTVEPGRSFSDTVRVTNNSTVPVSLAVDAVDGVTAQATGSVFADRGVAATRAGSWLSLGIRSLELAPGKAADVPFTVSVPVGARPGDHLAGVSVFNNAETSQQSGSLTVTTQTRSVVGVLVQVPGAAQRELAISGASLSLLDGLNVPAVTVAVQSPGGLLVKPRILVRLRSSTYDRTVERDLDTVLPESSIGLPERWPETLPAGRYALHIELSAPEMRTVIWDSEQTLGEQLAAAPAGSTGATAAREDRLPLWAVAGLGALGFALLLGLYRLLLLLWKRRKREDDSHLGDTPGDPSEPGPTHDAALAPGSSG